MKLSIDFNKLSDEQISNIIDIFVEQHPNEFEDLTIEAHSFELSCEKVEEKQKAMVKLLVGDFTFFDPQIDGEHKCQINRVDNVLDCANSELAEEIGENLLDTYESYLVLPTYTGRLDYQYRYHKLFEEIFG